MSWTARFSESTFSELSQRSSSLEEIDLLTYISNYHNNRTLIIGEKSIK